VNFTGPGIVYACANTQISTQYHAQAIVSHTFIRIHRNPGVTRLIRTRKRHKPRWYRTSATSDFKLMTSLLIISTTCSLHPKIQEKWGSATYWIKLRSRIRIRTMQRNNLMPHKIIPVFDTLGHRVRYAAAGGHERRSAPDIRRAGASGFLDFEPYGAASWRQLHQYSFIH
jgi:hypothetical protein